jgi:hypothetical protein
MMMGGKEFCRANHHATTWGTNADIKSERANHNKVALSQIVLGQQSDVKQMLIRG